MDLAPPIAVDTSILSSTNATAVEAAYDNTHTYAIGDLVNRNAVVTLAGDVAVTQGRAWKSLINANTGHDPATDDGTKWEDQGPTLPWDMFSDSATTQTTHADLLDVVLDLPSTERLNYAWLGNLAGTALQMICTDAGGDGEIYNRTFNLVADSGVDDWWSFFAYPIERLAEFLVADLPPLYSGLTVEIKITETGATVGCGAAVLGLGHSLGDTQWGVQIGRRDFSVLADDDFGDRVIVKRGFRKTLIATTNLDNALLDPLAAKLAAFRARPALFVADGAFASMAIWGFVKSFQAQVPGPARSFTSLELESMTQ